MKSPRLRVGFRCTGLRRSPSFPATRPLALANSRAKPSESVFKRYHYHLAAPLRNAMQNAARQLQRLMGAFMAEGMTFDYHDEHHAEGGETDDRC